MSPQGWTSLFSVFWLEVNSELPHSQSGQCISQVVLFLTKRPIVLLINSQVCQSLADCNLDSFCPRGIIFCLHVQILFPRLLGIKSYVLVLCPEGSQPLCATNQYCIFSVCTQSCTVSDMAKSDYWPSQSEQPVRHITNSTISETHHKLNDQKYSFQTQQSARLIMNSTIKTTSIGKLQ